jgi:Ca2+/Na+ antiporter
MQLIVVIAALARNRASLAIGNIIGSAISNILGAFSLGLLFHNSNEAVRFDRSARVYSLVLLATTTVMIPMLYLPTETTWLACGTVLIASFVIYLASVGWAISRGSLAAPEGSDSDSSHDDDSSDNESSRNRDAERDRGGSHPPLHIASAATPLLPRQRSSKHRPLYHHVVRLLVGFLAICISGYVLSHAASSVVDELGISDLLFGVVILSIATTLPEKFIAVMSGRRGQPGILVASTAGSNIFLLTLCAGIVLLSTQNNFPRGNVGAVELATLWGGTVAFAATVWFGGGFARWIGGAMLASYVAFVVAEFLVVHE